MEKVEALGVTFEEIKERTGLSKDFVISAVVNGSFPGSYKITECGKRYIYVPRGAFEDYMTKWHREPSEKLIDALIIAYNKSTKKALRQQYLTKLNHLHYRRYLGGSQSGR